MNGTKQATDAAGSSAYHQGLSDVGVAWALASNGRPAGATVFGGVLASGRGALIGRNERYRKEPCWPYQVMMPV